MGRGLLINYPGINGYKLHFLAQLQEVCDKVCISEL
jgi:hypothetical protein